jgi:hypothetical protein
MTLDRRFVVVDNLGWQPCIEPMLLGRLMDRVCEGRAPSLTQRIAKALAELRKRIAR